MCLEHRLQAQDRPRDRAFMGTTHALSGLAVLLAVVAFLPDFAAWAHFTDPAVIALAAMVVTGSALLPDLDNTTATAKNTLGLFGEALSIVFRGSSRAIQTVVRTRRDDSKIDPHRGFWHTIPAVILLGLLTWLLTGITVPVTLPLVGSVTVGWIGALLVSFVSIRLAFAGFFGKLMRKVLKGSAAFETVAIAAATIGTTALFWLIPEGQSFWWLSVAVALGALVHILGDAFTTAGVPLLFPLSGIIKGKFWWTTRFLPIKAGGPEEKWIFLPLFGILALVSLVVILIP